MDISKFSALSSMQESLWRSRAFIVPESLANFHKTYAMSGVLQTMQSLQQQHLSTLEIFKTMRASQFSEIYKSSNFDFLKNQNQTLSLYQKYPFKNTLHDEVQKIIQNSLSASGVLSSSSIFYTAQKHLSLSKNIYSELDWLRNKNIIHQLDKFTPALSILSQLKNLPVDLLGSYTFDDKDGEIYTIYEDELTEKEIIEKFNSDISQSISENKDFNDLSSYAKKAITYFLHEILFKAIILAITSSYMYDNLFSADEELKNCSIPEIKAIASGRQQVSFDRAYLKSYRVVIAEALSLREEPSMKSEVVAKISKGTLLEILDKSNRSWLKVSVEVDDEVLIGWVSRKYTLHFK